jgi:hypothetical protein
MRTLAVATTLFFFAATAAADMLRDAKVVNIAPTPALRGADVTLGTVGLSGEYEHVRVQLTRVGRDIKPASESVQGAFSDDASTIEFSVPRALPLGTYKVALYVTPPTTPPQTEAAPPPHAAKELEVQVAPPALHLSITTNTPVELTAVHPTVSFPKRNRFEFRAVGSGFSTVSEDNVLEVDGVGKFVACVEPGVPKDCVIVLADDDGREVLFSGFAKEDVTGLQKIRVRVGQSVSAWKDVRLSRVGKLVPMSAAIGTVLLLALIVWITLRPLRSQTPAGVRWNPPSTLFLDVETNTYSLSKLQLYVWMAAAVFGYAYLTISYLFVQGADTLPDIPANLPGILLVSVATSALSTGITAAKGSKGAGALRPSVADFLTSGGVLAPDRLQFFGWTIVGAAAFVALIMLRPPATIKDLPTVPEGLLLLMGISSAGYLGGKLARRAGPVIKQIVALLGSPLVIEIRGESLSPNATITIDVTPLTRAHLDASLHPDGRPVAEIEPGSEFSKLLRLTLPTPPPEWRQGTHTLLLVNPDGQRAVATFDVVSREAAGRALPIASPQRPLAPPHSVSLP